MNLIPEEQILIKDIFAVTVNPNDHTAYYLPDFAKQIAAFGRNSNTTQPMSPSFSTPPTSTPSSWNACKHRTVVLN